MTKINLYAKYGSDKTKEQKGVPFFIDKDSDTYISVARWTNRNIAHSKAQAELSKNLIGVDEVDAENARKRVFIEHLVTGWNNITDKDGKDLPFTTENAIALLEDLPDLADELFAFSLQRENYAIDGVEEITKN